MPYAPTRTSILGALREALEPLPYVHAMYEGGAVSFGRLDAWSDVDLYLVVDDDKVDGTFRAVEGALARLAPVEVKFPVPHPPASGTAQAFYRLAGAGPFLLVDLAVLTMSAPDKYLEPEIHGPAVFHFNKGGAVAVPHVDREAFEKRMRERLARLRTRFELFSPYVEKELNRRNPLEALDAYRVIFLDSLVEVLRMKHGPLHFNFRARYVHYELPPDVARRLEALAFVRDIKELPAKAQEAGRWFRETAEDLAATAEA